MKRYIIPLLLVLNFNFSFSQMPKKELRGVWIATVKNIDWPSEPGISSQEKIKEIKEIVDILEKKGINAVFFQVRTESDAFYEKSNEPWSAYLTGKQGQAPIPFFDPLQLLIDEAHARGIEVHAWFNLNRGVFSTNQPIAKNHIYHQHPDWFITYQGQRLYNFGLPEVRNYLSNLMVDIAKNYPIDGIHLDDYFYPYPKKGVEFGDYSTFTKYRKGKESLADWRRGNIDQIIYQIHHSIEKLNPKISFGISPFGIWQHEKNDPKGSKTTNGLQSYHDLFADTRSWMEKGWIDYLAPQLYWSTTHPVAPFELLAKWWDQNHFNRHIYAGMAIYHIEDNWNLNEIKNQMGIVDQLNHTQGKIFFSYHILTNNYKKIGDFIEQEAFNEKTLIPAMPWKDSIPPLPPKNLNLKKEGKNWVLTWDKPEKASDGDLPKFYAVYESNSSESKQSKLKIVKVLNSNKLNFSDELDLRGKKFMVSSIDQTNNESILSSVIEAK